MPILNPNMVPKALSYEHMSKGQLAELVNQQTRELQACMRDKHNIMALLCAIVRHPDAFTVNADGHAQITVESIVELKENTELKTEKSGEHMVLTVRESTYLLHAEPMRLGMAVRDIH